MEKALSLLEDRLFTHKEQLYIAAQAVAKTMGFSTHGMYKLIERHQELNDVEELNIADESRCYPEQ